MQFDAQLSKSFQTFLIQQRGRVESPKTSLGLKNVTLNPLHTLKKLKKLNYFNDPWESHFENTFCTLLLWIAE